MSDSIVIHGACQNNLKNLSLELPLNEVIVVTGVSGSGKSSLRPYVWSSITSPSASR